MAVKARCPRCGGSRAKPRHVMPLGANPFSFPPGGRLPLCGHHYHQKETAS